MNALDLFRPRDPVDRMMVQTARRYPKVRVDDDMTFEREKQFAVAIINNNKDLKRAIRDPSNDQTRQSVGAAILQSASMGLTLNPTVAHCYLIPYEINGKSTVQASPGYRGLLYLAQESGAILWAKADVVYENDVFEPGDTATAPKHGYNVFQERGKKIGAYVVAKTRDGAYLTDYMSAAQIGKVRERSKAKKSLMWTTFEEEGWVKAVIRRAWKRWPTAQHGEVINRTMTYLDETEGMQVTEEPKGEAVILISDDQITQLHAVLTDHDYTPEGASKQLQRLARTFGQAEIKNLAAKDFEQAKAKLENGLKQKAVQQ